MVVVRRRRKPPDDHREALAFLLGREPDLEVVAREALRGRRLDVAVVDLSLPDGDGPELIEGLRRSSPGVSAVVLSATLSAGNAKQLRRLARGLLSSGPPSY